MNFKDIKITVIGLGYVGLPLAVEFAKKYIVFGFDINQKRIDDLRKGIDSTLEVENKDLLTVLANTSSNGFFPTTDIDDIASSNIFIITVPTPVDENNKPILTPLIKASEIVGSILKEGDVVIYDVKEASQSSNYWNIYRGNYHRTGVYITENQCIPGDINADSIINILDIILLVNIVLSIDEPDYCGDINSDGMYNILDIVLMANIILGN